MNRRTVFTAIASLALVAGAVPIGGLALTAVAQSLAPRPTETPVPATIAATPGPASPSTSGPASAGSSTSPVDRPLAERLRPLAAGDQLVTFQQLRDFVAEYKTMQSAQYSEMWAAEANIEVQCMSTAGFYWDPREVNIAMTDPSQPAVPVDPAARLALDGNAGNPYHWQDAGCRGLAIQQAGSGN